MTDALTRPLWRLAGALATLKARVRSALAGELARVLGDGVREVAAAVIAGRHADAPSDPDGDYHRPPRRQWDEDEDDRWDRPRDEWDDDDAEDGYGRPVRHPTPPAEPTTATRSAGVAAVTAAVAAGVHAARWWLTRRGSILGALTVGVAVGLAGLAGGPATRAGLATLTAAGDLLAVSDALAASPAGG